MAAAQALVMQDSLSSSVAPSEDAGGLAPDALVREMLAGSARAWRAFHDRYDRVITRVIDRFSAVVGQDEVRDIYATLLVQLISNDMRKLRSFDADRGTHFGAWLSTLAAPCAYDHLPKKNKIQNRLGAILSEACLAA